ncbi:unnamed protein product, partial [Mesorhabditis spiculigera]
MIGAVIFSSCFAVTFAQFAPAPLYSACSPAVPCAGGLACQASVCIPVAAAPVPPPPNRFLQAPVYAPAYPAPAPVYAAPAPVAYAPVPAPPPVPVVAAQPPMPVPPPACAPGCIGGGACVSGACQCAAPVVYSPVVGCAPAPVPIAPVPVVAGRLIPQALPGAPCEPGVECTGGSVCSLGVCVCPPELVQEGTVCVARTVYGVVPPPVVPVPMPAPVAMIPVGAACAPPAPVLAAAPPPPACVPGAMCSPAGVCACAPAYAPVQGACVRRKHAKQAEKEEKDE